MTLNQLECFMVLAQRLNFTQAADDLFMAQPALSRLISALEKELDLQLFYRNSRSVALTPAGTVFFKKCPKILDEYRGSVVGRPAGPGGLSRFPNPGHHAGHLRTKAAHTLSALSHGLSPCLAAYPWL